MTLCIDCGNRTKNRSKSTKRCVECHKKNLSKKSKGRKTGICINCGGKLSTKKNSTKMCRNCYFLNTKPWNKGTVGICKAWNKGKSLFKNKEEYTKHKNELRKKRRKLQSNKIKISDRLRTLIRNSIKYYGKGRKKNTKTEILLGCDIDFFIKHLENQFIEWMDWENYGNGVGKWNIDHIEPISSFDLSNLEEQKKAFNYKNCRPMDSIDNLKKGKKQRY
jgi:hypothetical protein